MTFSENSSTRAATIIKDDIQLSDLSNPLGSVGNYNNAIKHYQKAISSAKNAIEPKLGLSQVYMAKHAYGDAKKILYEVLKLDLSNYYANLYLTRVLRLNKEYSAGKNLVYRMLALYPTGVPFLEELAQYYELQKEVELAKSTYEDIIILDPNNILAKGYLRALK